MPRPTDIPNSIVEGLTGEALYIASAMAFIPAESLPFFDVSAKTAAPYTGWRTLAAESR